MDRREFLKKAGLGSLGATAVFLAPTITTVKARAAYEAMTTVKPTSTPRPTNTPEPTPETTPEATSTPTPEDNPGARQGDNEVGPPTVSYYTWNVDGCYYRNHFGNRTLVVCSPNGPGTYNFPEGWVHP